MKKKLAVNYSTFDFNPFGGLDDMEIQKVIVPKFDLDSIVDLITQKDQIIIELVGKKGRGKTLHLKYLNLLLDNSTIFYLDSKSKLEDIPSGKSEIVLIDSIHHFNLFDRIKFFKANKKIVLTTHLSRRLEYRLVGKPYKLFKFKGIDAEVLQKIINNRIKIASNDLNNSTKISSRKVEELIKIYKDDFRGILNHLYDEFQLER